MRIRHRDDGLMRLAGVPGGVGWMIFATLLGLLFTAAFGWFALAQYRSGGIGFGVVMCSLGVLLGQLFMWTGIVTLAVARESLELDTRAGGGRYRSRSPIVDVPKPFEFDLSNVHAVSIERYTERSPGGRRGGGMSEMDVCRARLLISKPRRAVTMDQTSNHRDQRVISLATQVAEFLGVPMEETDRRRDR